MNNNMTAIQVYEEMVCDSPKQAKQYFDACVEHMDDDIREHLAGISDETTNDRHFLFMYCEHHKAKFNEEFVVN